MAFIEISPNGMGGRGNMAKDSVRCRCVGGGIQFSVAKNIAELLGFHVGKRVLAELGSGTDAGRMRFTLAERGYRVVRKVNSQQSLIAIGANRIGLDRRCKFPNTDCKYEIVDDSLIVTLPPLEMKQAA